MVVWVLWVYDVPTNKPFLNIRLKAFKFTSVTVIVSVAPAVLSLERYALARSVPVNRFVPAMSWLPAVITNSPLASGNV
jgi:hypothetical protein